MSEELARLRDDDASRCEILDRASVSMLHRSALGGQMIERICATQETAPDLEPLIEAGVDSGRHPHRAREPEEARQSLSADGGPCGCPGVRAGSVVPVPSAASSRRVDPKRTGCAGLLRNCLPRMNQWIAA